MTWADGDAESGASGLSAGNGGSAEEGGVADGAAEDKGKCKKACSSLCKDMTLKVGRYSDR